MGELPPLLLLVMGVIALVGLIESLRAIAVAVRDGLAIHDLMVATARTRLEYLAAERGEEEIGQVDIVDDEPRPSS
ncbi:MAG: hypothetical protein ACIARR_08555 [Phycisphaerales bacterium JB059]